MRLPRTSLGTAAVLIFILAVGSYVTGCGDKTTVTLQELGGGLTGSDDLPDGVVALDTRAGLPATSFTLACPWGSIADPASDPNLVGLLLPEAIPAVDDPRWLPVGAPDLALIDGEPVIAVEVEGDVRALPVRMLLHHEIVNMCWNTGTGARYTYLTYCPLVDAAVHFTDARRCTAKKKYGVSGAIYNGNLITYDRATAVEGETPQDMFVQLYAGGLFGSCAAADAGSMYMSWGMFHRLFPGGSVLSADTGNPPGGGYDLFDHPYADYWQEKDTWFPTASTDARLPEFEPVLGILVADARKAYPARGTWAINDTVAGVPVAVWNDEGFIASTAYEAVHDGLTLTFRFAGRERHTLPLFTDEQTGSHWNIEGIAVEGPLAGARLPRLMAIRTFWFAWSSMYPATTLCPTGGGS